MFKKIRVIIFSLIFLSFLLSLGNAKANMTLAGAYLESTQNDDGSWGTNPSTIYFETTEAIKALRLLGRTGSAYQKKGG